MIYLQPLLIGSANTIVPKSTPHSGGVFIFKGRCYNLYMPYKTGTWGEQAKARAQKRTAWFYKYNKNRDPKKKNARRKVELALSSGTLKKLPCEKCGKKRSQAHHPDYDKPLKIVWLCTLCHRHIHKK